MSNKPVHKVNAGRGTVASIWENEGKNGSFWNVTLDRTYRDGEELKSSSSFGRDDLLSAAKALELSHTWILEREAEARAGRDS